MRNKESARKTLSLILQMIFPGTPLPPSAGAHLSPDLLLLIHTDHTITDHVVHQVRGLDVFLQSVAKAQQTASGPFLHRHLCTTHQPCKVVVC